MFRYFKRLTRLVNRVFGYLQNVYTLLYLRAHGVEATFGTVTIVGRPTIIRAEGSRIVLGKGVTLVSSGRFNPAGICHPVTLATLRTGAIIRIGNGCGLSGATICAAMEVTLSDHCMMGANSSIYDTDFHSTNHTHRRTQTSLDNKVPVASVHIGQDVWIGLNATILKGVNVGDRSIIGAGAVVTKSIPSDCTAVGVPAKVINHLRASESNIPDAKLNGAE